MFDFTGAIIIGAASVNTTAFERRFHLTSVQVGWMLSMTHISAATLGTLVSYAAKRYCTREREKGEGNGFTCDLL